MTDPRWQLVAYVFVSIVLWMVAGQLLRRRNQFTWMRHLSRDAWPATILRFVYYVGLPYVALILGVVPARYLGLAGLDRLQPGRTAAVEFGPQSGVPGILARFGRDISLLIWSWLPDIPTLASLGTLMLLLLGVTWLGYAYARGRLFGSLGSQVTAPERGEWSPDPGSIYQAIHWAFYRSAMWLITDDLYLGVVGGILLVALEWMLEPARSEPLMRIQAGQDRLVDASVLIATSTIFFFVPNLWLIVPLHWLLRSTSRRLVALRMRSTERIQPDRREHRAA